MRLWITLVGAAMAVAIWGGIAQAANPEDHPVVKAQIYAHETWPDEFAGLWLDFDYPRADTDDGEGGIPPDQKVFIAFTTGAEEKVAELRQRFPAANPYVAVTHAYSLTDLEALQRKVSNDLRAYTAGQLEIPGPAFEWHATGIWVVDNVLEVNLSKVTPQYEAWAADRYAPMASALRIFVGEKVAPMSGKPKRMCGAACRKAKAVRKARVKARKQALRKKCRRAARNAVRTGSPKARKFARSKKCRAVRRPE